MANDIIDDQQVIADGRTAALKDVDAPLRDQVIKKLVDNLNEQKFGSKVQSLHAKAAAERSEWMERQKAYLSTWDEFITVEGVGPYKGASNLHIPMPFWVCKAVHARFVSALEDFVVRARNAASVPNESVVKETLQYAIQEWGNHNRGMFPELSRWLWDWVTIGEGFIKLRWDVSYTRFLDVEVVKEPGAPRVALDEAGKEILVPTMMEVEREVKRSKKCYEGPVAECVPYEDIFVVGDPDPQRADHIVQVQYLTASELWTAADRKVFLKDEVEAVIQGGPDKRGSADLTGYAEQKNSNAAFSPTSSPELDRYAIFEVHSKVDVDGSGIASDVVAWIAKTSGRILRATYAHRIHRTGQRPFFRIEYHMHSSSQRPMGLVEMLYPLSKELDAHHNMRIDFGYLATMPYGFYRPTSNIEAERLELAPGVLIPVDNPQTDVYFPNLSNRTSWGFQEEASIMSMVERLTNISDLNLGLITGQGATRTATGSRVLANEGATNLDVYLRNLNVGWRMFLNYLLDMLQQRMPDGLEFRVTGHDGGVLFRHVSPEDMQGNYDLEVSGSTASSNKQIQIEVAKEVLQITGSPMDLQIGIVTPANRYEAIKNYLTAIGIKDFSRFVNGQFEQAPPHLLPEEEAGRVLRGVDVPVLPAQDHQAFITYVEFMLKDDSVLGQFSNEQALRLEMQRRKHVQMMQAVQQMQAQQANLQQQRVNAANSQAQTPVGPVQGSDNQTVPQQ